MVHPRGTFQFAVRVRRCGILELAAQFGHESWSNSNCELGTYQFLCVLRECQLSVTLKNINKRAFSCFSKNHALNTVLTYKKKEGCDFAERSSER